MKKYLFKKCLLSFILLASFRPSIADTLNIFIQNVSPGMNSVSVNRSSDINILFTQQMNESTLNEENINVSSNMSGRLPISLNYVPSTRTLIIDPQRNFSAGEDIRVTLTSGIQNFANIPITPFSYSFIAEATGGGYFSITDSIDITGNVRAGDADKDGDVDLLVGNEVDGLKVFSNDGLGHFVFTENIPLANSQFELEDYDADGDLDVLSSVDNDHVQLFLNNGIGNFSPSAISNVHLGKAGDFNNDGYPDLAYFSNGFDISININNNGTFHLSNTIAVGHECNLNCYPAADFKIEDMDNDGDLDIVVLHMTACENPFFFMGCRYVDVLKNDGQGNFTNINILSDPFPGDDGSCWEHVIFLTSLNFDNDTDMDLILSTKKISNSGDYEFQFSNMSFLYRGQRPNVFDFDGDRDLDVVYYDYVLAEFDSENEI
ncbi:MAG: VCBS repeat-containing protein [Ignavibacteria bacterium]|nr:VCBS repeat-containing protein [Ignavibacteria bacterium]